MIGRICGTRMRSCSCHQPAPSMRAASAVSGGRASSAARNTTTAKPNCCQTTRPPTETIARWELPSQSCASAPRCSLRSAVLSTPFPCNRNENAMPIAVAGSTYGRKTIAWYWRMPRMRSLRTSAIARPRASITGTASSSFMLLRIDVRRDEVLGPDRDGRLVELEQLLRDRIGHERRGEALVGGEDAGRGVPRLQCLRRMQEDQELRRGTRMLRPLRDERIRRLRHVVTGRELPVPPDRDRPDAHVLPAELLLPGRDVAVGAPRHPDLLLAEQLEALLEADRGDVRIEVAVLPKIHEQLVEAGELGIGELGLADHRVLELVDRVEVLLPDQREEPRAAVAVLVPDAERRDASGLQLLRVGEEVRPRLGALVRIEARLLEERLVPDERDADQVLRHRPQLALPHVLGSADPVLGLAR